MLFRPMLLILMLLACQTALAVDNPFPRVAAAYLVQVNGSPLWEKAGARRLPPASLTKLLTALLVAEATAAKDVVAISREAALERGTRLGVRADERFRVEDLLGATLLASDNDACLALAVHVGGTQTRFVERMNRRAALLGMRNSHFANACGHDAENHYSTAQDLALLADAVLKNQRLSALTAQDTAEIAALDGVRRFNLANKNALIGRYPGARGLKTGFTPKAGKCLIAFAERGAVRVLLVMLNAPNRWWDATDILDLAFAHERSDP